MNDAARQQPDGWIATDFSGLAASLIAMSSRTQYSLAKTHQQEQQFQSLIVESAREHVTIMGLCIAISIESMEPEWNPRHTRSNLTSLVTSSLRPKVFKWTRPILLFAKESARKSSPAETVMPRTLTPLVGAGCHFLIKSQACLPDVELFSSDLTHTARQPDSEATKKPFANSLIADMLYMSSAASSPIL